MRDIDLWRTLALFVVAVGQTCFVLLYTTFPWYKSFVGRALFYKALMLALITDTFIVVRFFGFENTDVLFLSLYSMLGIGVWWQFFAFLSVRRAGKQNQRNPNSPHKSAVVSGNAMLSDRQAEAVEVSEAADVAEAAAIETALAAANAVEAANVAARAYKREN